MPNITWDETGGKGFDADTGAPVTFIPESPDRPVRVYPTLDWGMLEWTEDGCELDPRSRMLATVQVGPMLMHLEAWAVETPDGEVQQFECRCDDPDEDGMVDEFLKHCLSHAFDSVAEGFDQGVCWQTVEVEGRQYVLIAQPFGD